MHATDVELDSFLIWTVAVLVAIVATLYSSVGHGGASGYLAILSFTTVAPDEMATTSLILNIIVASISFLFYGRVRYFSLRLTLPFIATSIPAAFVGGMLPVSIIGYQLLLALILVFAAVRLFSIRNGLPEERSFESIKLYQSMPAGAIIGLLSGLVGVGGGIFLSPLLLLMKWANVKTTAATSAFFIVANALAGLAGRYARDGLVVGNLAPLLVAGILGGAAGANFGANKLGGTTIRRLLSVVLLIASLKLILRSL